MQRCDQGDASGGSEVMHCVSGDGAGGQLECEGVGGVARGVVGLVDFAGGLGHSVALSVRLVPTPAHCPVPVGT